MIYPYGLYYDPLILAVIAVFILGLIAQGRVTRTFSKYSKEPASSGLTGQEVAQRLLDQGGSSVTIRPVRGSLTDHFDPRNQTVGLSDSVYGSRSIAALAVAAHEIGHVMQYEEGYFPIRLRNAILPVVTYVGPMLAGLMTGSFVVEKIFSIPGLGRDFVSAITNRDYMMIMGTTILLATLVIVANVIVDILYKIIDPRIKLK